MYSNTLFDTNKKEETIIEIDSSFSFKEKRIIGVDETGVGDYFGPLISAAVLVSDKQIEYLKSIGVKDSKKITSDSRIIDLANQIKSKCLYKVYTLSNAGYNRVEQTYRNSNKLKFFTHAHVINSLEELLESRGSEYDYVFIDQYTTKNAFIEYFNNMIYINNWSSIKVFKKPILLSHKAESIHISVAAASILARAELLENMKKMKAKYNFDFKLGASKQVKELVQKFKEKFGEEELKNVCKTSFKL
ncbi:ribonuclease HIII [Mycoplasma crocodyli]|uniref:Ribonuclease n=1 Tax=Mycoplasma crocodyli (strain ATCC 51981 / MP145) TaxID=512564 RepID=D5E4R1_MYCCM|nr:ribonuclease HIII [Mycoplasma crocodyli]ADE19369.1 ribonuclease HII [Mycoplasma crocodyli MP145]